MKTLLFSILLISSTWAQATCNRRVDPSKVVLFVDTNTSDLEIDTARAAACQRGERLVVVPQNYRQYTPHVHRLEAIEMRYRSADCYVRSSAACDALRQEKAPIQSAYDNFRRQHPTIPQEIERTIAGLSGEGAKVRHLVISGHDRGGSFSGQKTEPLPGEQWGARAVSREGIAQIMAQYPDVNDVQGVSLLGCYTGIPNEMLNWSNAFPSVKLIGGYDGRAPLSSRPLGHQYLNDILTKEPQIIAQAEANRLNAWASANIRGLASMNTAMFVRTCEEDEGVYYASGNGETEESLTTGPRRRFTSFEDHLDCTGDPQIRRGLIALAREFEQYHSGQIEPPTDTTNGAIRRINNRAETLEHCIQSLRVGPDKDQVFNLLFWHDVKKNFAKSYEADLARAEGDLANLSPELRGPLFVPNFTNITQRSRRDLMRNIHYIEGLLNQPDRLSPRQLSALSWMNDVATRHLVQLRNPFEWHEYRGAAVTPANRIPYNP